MGMPGAAAGPGDEFVVYADRGAIHSRHSGILVVDGIVAAAVIVMIIWVEGLELGPMSALPLLIVLVGQMFQLSYHSFLYGSRIAISEPLVLNHWGFAMNTAAGRMEVPWQAVAGVQVHRRLTNRLLIIRLYPAAGPGSPGLETDISARYWARMRRFGGPTLGERGIQQSFDEIKQAVGFFSQGKVPIGG